MVLTPALSISGTLDLLSHFGFCICQQIQIHSNIAGTLDLISDLGFCICQQIQIHCNIAGTLDLISHLGFCICQQIQIHSSTPNLDLSTYKYKAGPDLDPYLHTFRQRRNHLSRMRQCPLVHSLIVVHCSYYISLLPGWSSQKSKCKKRHQRCR